MIDSTRGRVDVTKKGINCFRFQFVLSTCLSPGTSPTALPSARTQMISGWGFPLAWHSTTAPVPFEKSTRFGGSLTNTGPIDSSSAQATAGKRGTRSVRRSASTSQSRSNGNPPACSLRATCNAAIEGNWLIETVNGTRNFCCVSFSLAYHPSGPGYATPTFNWRVANCSKQQVAGLLLNNMLSTSRDHKGETAMRDSFSASEISSHPKGVRIRATNSPLFHSLPIRSIDYSSSDSLVFILNLEISARSRLHNNPSFHLRTIL